MMFFSSWVRTRSWVLSAVVFIFTVVTFIECFRKARFSYYMVACGGVALFTAFTIVLALYDMQWYNTFRFFLMNLSDSGFVFAVLTTPLMLVLSAAIAGSNIWLLRHEGRRPQNMLGIGLGLLWVLGIAAVIGSSVYYFGYSDNGVALSTQISYSIAYVLSYMECLLLSTIVSAFLSTKYKPPYDKDYLIVLGCGIRKDGSLTPILKGRVDAAIRFERAQFAAAGRHAKFVPSGGQGSDEVISESEAMKRYLLEQGYPEEQIIKEDKSVNTDQNIRFSREKIMADADNPETVRAGVATTNYHIFRAFITATNPAYLSTRSKNESNNSILFSFFALTIPYTDISRIISFQVKLLFYTYFTKVQHIFKFNAPQYE